MAYKQQSNGLPFKQMGSTPAKQVKVDLSKKSGFGPRVDGSGQKELKKLKPRHPGRKVMKDGAVNKGNAAWLAKNKANFEKMMAAESTPAKQKTDSKVVSKNAEITIAANKKAAEIGKRGNKGKKRSDYTPAELALIKNPAYQKALNLALDKVMKDNPDTTGQ